MWTDFGAWLSSAAGARVLQTAIVPAVAILVAGLLAAAVGRAGVRSAIARADREQAATAVAGLVEAARAAVDADSTGGGRRRAARLRVEADVRVRLLPMPGAARAADWAAARTDELVAASSGGAADLVPLRDALVAWVARPARAKRLFVAPPALPAVPAASVPPSDEVPAWRRTKAAERLEQERSARTASTAVAAAPAGPAAPPEVDEGTAPIRRQHLHRAEPEAADAPHAPATASAPVVAAVPADQPARSTQPVTAGAPTPTPTATATAPSPDWLDTYDDEAHVTQNLDLRTPPPLAASALRDRASSGAGTDIVPRT